MSRRWLRAGSLPHLARSFSRGKRADNRPTPALGKHESRAPVIFSKIGSATFLDSEQTGAWLSGKVQCELVGLWQRLSARRTPDFPNGPPDEPPQCSEIASVTNCPSRATELDLAADSDYSVPLGIGTALRNVGDC